MESGLKLSRRGEHPDLLFDENKTYILYIRQFPNYFFGKQSHL